jgi:phage tail P2-like protein
MSTLLRGSRLIENCTPSISYDRQVQAASQAFDQQMWEIIDDTGQVVMIPNIMNLTDPNLVDILAWQFSVDSYDSKKDLEFRKHLVQQSILWHKTKGTLALVQEVLDTHWPGVSWVEEWYHYMSPLPPNYSDPVLAGTFTAADVSAAADTIMFAGMVNGQEVTFTNTGGALPAPVQPAPRIYYVINATATTFQIADEPTLKAVLNITDPGSGTNNLSVRTNAWHSRYLFRIVINQDVISPTEETLVLDMVTRYKPVSRWLDYVLRPYTGATVVYACARAQIFNTYRSLAAPIRQVYEPPLIEGEQPPTP